MCVFPLLYSNESKLGQQIIIHSDDSQHTCVSSFHLQKAEST